MSEILTAIDATRRKILTVSTAPWPSPLEIRRLVETYERMVTAGAAVVGAARKIVDDCAVIDSDDREFENLMDALKAYDEALKI